MDDSLRELDATGLKCPLPVLRARKAIARLPANYRLLLKCTDPMAEIDIPHMVIMDNLVLHDRGVLDGTYWYIISK